MDWLLLYGSFAVGTMLLMYALEDRGNIYVAGFAVACAASSVYGFLAEAYPFGVLEAIWAGIAVRRWARRAAQSSSAAGEGVAQRG
jgi:hypothetical protein